MPVPFLVDFEDATTGILGPVINGASSSVTVIRGGGTDPAAQSGSFEAKMVAWDPPATINPHGQLSNFNWVNSDPSRGDNVGDDVWYGFALNISSSFPTFPNQCQIFQWFCNWDPPGLTHGNGFGFYLFPDRQMGWGLLSGVRDPVTGNWAYAQPNNTQGWGGNTMIGYPSSYVVPLGQWVKFLVRINGQTSATGDIEIYVRAASDSTWTQVLDQHGLPTMDSIAGRASDSYGFKLGPYTDVTASGPATYWMDTITRAESRAAVESILSGDTLQVAPLSATRTDSDWRTMICDLNGLPISNITRLASERAFQFRLNRPDSFTFKVPSDAPEVVGPWTDNRPYIEEGTRTIKAYRRETGNDGVDRYVLRFAGTIETVQDEGTTDDANTTVVAYSPFYTLNKRLCRDSAGNPANVTFDNASAVEIVANLIAWTTTYAGHPGIAWGGAARGGAIGTFTTSYQYQTIASAIIGLTDSFNGFDILWEPKDRTDGILATATVTARAGVTQAHVVFGWGVAPHNVETITNFKDRGTLANVIYGIGPDGAAVGPVSDGSSIALYRQLETAESLGDVNAAMVSPLITEELSFRKQPRQIVQIVPDAGVQFGPFLDFGLGDMINVWAGNRLRGGFTGVQRVYGFDLSLNEEAVERISAIYVSADT